MTSSAPAPSPSSSTIAYAWVDARPPGAVQALLERSVGAVLAPVAGDGGLRRARVRIGNVPGSLELRLRALVPGGHAFELALQIDTPPALSLDTTGSAESADRLKRQASSWMHVWMQGLGADKVLATVDAEGSRDRPVPPRPAEERTDTAAVRPLNDLLRAWQAAEQPWADAAATQRTIVQALRAGASFTVAHKEGATTIAHDARGFVRVDEGDSPGTQRFATEAAVLRQLRALYDHDITQHAEAAGLSEADAWRLVHRHLDAAAVAHGGARRMAGRLNLPVLVTVVVGCLVAGVLGYLRWHPKAEALRASSTSPRVDRVVTPPIGAASAVDWQGLQQRQHQAVEAAKAAARAASR